MQVQNIFQSLSQTNENDQWIYIWGTNQFSSVKIYKRMLGHPSIHKAYGWLWRSSCPMKHKVFFWLFLKSRLNTRGSLHRKNMDLESYTCDMCIWQYEETIQHLFQKCNLAKACWAAIGINMPTSNNRKRVILMLKRRIGQPFAMEVIILMTWAIWSTRNEWIFNNKDPKVDWRTVRPSLSRSLSSFIGLRKKILPCKTTMA
jgi:hypothetical protein